MAGLPPPMPKMKSAMMDKSKKGKAPKQGDDFNEKMTTAGKTTPNMPDRDGPAKRSASPRVQAPPTSAAPAPMAAPNMQHSTGPIKKAPTTSMMPQASMVPMPSPAMLNNMRSSAMKSGGQFKK